MGGLPVSDARFLEALVAAAMASPCPQWAVEVETGLCLFLNPAAEDWLRTSRLQLPDEAAILRAIERAHAERGTPMMLTQDLAAGPELLRREWLRRRSDVPARRDSDWYEVIALRVTTPDGEMVLRRARAVADIEVSLAHGGDLRETLAAAVGLETPAGVALGRVDREDGLARWTYRDGLFETLRVDAPAAETLRRGGMAPFDTLLLRAAMLQAQAATWTLMLPEPQGPAQQPWLLSLRPRPSPAAGEPAPVLAQLHALPASRGELDAAGRTAAPLPGLAQFQCRADGSFTYLSEGWRALTGVPVDHALGRCLTDFCAAPLSRDGLALLAPVLVDGAAGCRHEWPFPRADGELRWLELRLWPDSADARRFSGTLADITERYRAQRFRQIMETALEHTVNGVVITDATQRGNPIVHVNGGFSAISGYSAAEVLGRNCNFMQGDLRDQPEVEAMRRAIARQEALTVVVRNFRKDGTPFWNQVELSPVQEPLTGLVTHFIGLQTDVTLKRQAEDANVLRALELERVFRGSPFGMVTFDATGRVRLLSPAFLKLLALPGTRLMGATQAELVAALSQALGVADTPLAWPEADAHVRWELPGEPVRILDVSLFHLGKVTGEQIAFFRDVTAEQTESATKSQFLAMAAHELRTPMGSICGFTELLLMRNYSREEARPMLETVLRQAMRLSTLLNDLLDLSQMDAMGAHAFPVGPVGLEGVMQRAVQVAVMPGSGRSIEVQLPPGSPRVQGNATKLEQVLINLLSNAIKYSPGGGVVRLRAEADAASGACRIAVSDTGLGLSEAHRARLFTRFFRADPSGPIPGTGLGLVIVKELVERMGGHIDVESELGVGTTFILTLRLSP